MLGFLLALACTTAAPPAPAPATAPAPAAAPTSAPAAAPADPWWATVPDAGDPPAAPASGIPELDEPPAPPPPPPVPAPTPVVTDPCEAALAVDRRCRADSDCVAVDHVVDCCGTRQVIGVRSDAKAGFTQLEQACGEERQACKCMAGPRTDEDGRQGMVFAATCRSGRCRSVMTAIDTRPIGGGR